MVLVLPLNVTSQGQASRNAQIIMVGGKGTNKNNNNNNKNPSSKLVNQQFKGANVLTPKLLSDPASPQHRGRRRERDALVNARLKKKKKKPQRQTLTPAGRRGRAHARH